MSDRQDERPARMFFTQNDIADDERRALVELLNQTLADTTDLLTQTKYAHWNVKGQNFYQLHLLFDELADELFEHGDDIAERATALGGEARGTVRMAATNTRIPEIRTNAVTGLEYVEALANNLALHAANLRGGIDAAISHGDQDTADLLTELSREVDKYLWFLEAHLQREPIQSTNGRREPEAPPQNQNQNPEAPQPEPRRYEQGPQSTR
ncbi:DNA starvation/stationary phase protection protein Dps [Haladaptatus sp. CMAA 1911]|uniref:DNA starvation/stationary phase protection protein Dps n=1 Tax=unclassified Haladaptatus TaxID=2622732 RepID=UPI0037546F46